MFLLESTKNQIGGLEMNFNSKKNQKIISTVIIILVILAMVVPMIASAIM